MVKKFKIFWTMSRTTKVLLFEAYLHLAWASILKKMPFSKIAPLLGERMEETSFSLNPLNIETIQNISHSLHIMSRYTWWESKCLVMAIAAMKMLERRQIESTLYLGTARDEKGKMIAHAWLRSGSYYITGANEIERYTIVAKFAKKNRNQSVGELHGKLL